MCKLVSILGGQDFILSKSIKNYLIYKNKLFNLYWCSVIKLLNGCVLDITLLFTPM